MEKFKLKHVFSLIMILLVSVLLVACGTKIYTMTFKVDNRVYGVIGKYEEGETIKLPNPPTKAGYTFSKWSINIPKRMPAKDLTAYARFTPNTYTITFDYNGATEGSSVTNLSVTFDSPVGTLPTPSKEGYMFDGWYLDSKEYNASTIYTHTENITLTAKFTATKVGVYFYTDSEFKNLHQFIEVEYGSGLSKVPTVPNKDGYSATWSVTDFSNITTLTKVYPVYTANTYTITFDYNGATGGNSKTNTSVVYGEKTGELPSPLKNGQYFIGWYVGSSLIASDITYNYATNVTAVAKYSSSRYVINFYTDSSKNSLYTTRYLGAGESTLNNIPTPPTKTGCLSEWNVTLDTITSNVDVYAEYTYIDYTITYKIGTETYKTDTYHYGDTIILPEVGDTDDYIFVKWDTKLTTMPAENITINAVVVYFALDISNYGDSDVINITKGGTYTISGTSSGATILIDTIDKVTLNLNGVTYSGNLAFIKSESSGDVDIITMSGTTNTVDILGDDSGISVIKNLKLGGQGTLNITTVNTGIHAENINITNGDVHIDSSADAIVASSMNVSGGRLYVTTAAFEGEDRFVFDDHGDYVFMYGGYILDTGVFASETHYRRITTYGVVLDEFTLSGGLVSINSGDTAMVVESVEISAGALDIISGDVGIKATTVSIEGGDINLNSIADIGINANVITCNSGDIYVNSGSVGLKSATSITLEGTKVVIESKGDAIYGETISLTSVTATITTNGTFVRDDTNGLYKFDNGKYTRFLKADYGKFGQRFVTTDSVKGIYATDSVTIHSGDYIFNTVETSIYSQDLMYIYGGNISIISQCEALYSRALIQIGYADVTEISDKFNIVVSNSYVGISAGMLEMYDGNTIVYSHTDGVYVRPSETDGIDHYMNIAGVGTLAISAEEDGLDVSGNLLIDGGHTFIYSGNTLNTLSVRYTNNFYYLSGEILFVGNNMYTPNKYSAEAHFVAFSLDPTQYRRCTKNTYIMLYDDIENPTEEDIETRFSVVIYLGIRNYISGMSIMYASGNMLSDHKYSLRYGSAEYIGGVVPSQLPYICSGGKYNEIFGDCVAGIVFEENMVGYMYGQFSSTSDTLGTVGEFTKCNVLDEFELEFNMHAEGSVKLNPVTPPDPLPEPGPEPADPEN